MWRIGIFYDHVADRDLLRRLGRPARDAHSLPFAPWSQIATLAFLVSVVVVMAFDESGRIVLARVPVIVLALVVGWFGVRKRIDTSVLEKSA
jgi:L-asparagine permease